MTTAGVFLVHRAAPGRRDAVRDVWERHLSPVVAANAGHLAYFYCFDDNDPDVIRVFQQYASAAAAAAFLQTPEYAAYLAAVEPLLVGPPDVAAATPMWTKGS